MITGCDAPRPRPSTNDSAISSGTLSTNGNSRYAAPASVIAEAMSSHWRTRRTSMVSSARTTKVAMAKLDMMMPMVPAVRPMREP